MKMNVSDLTEFRKYYLSEFELYDGEDFITFNIVGINLDRNEIQLAVTDRGKISVVTYDLYIDKKDKLYFEYGVMFERVYLQDFEEVALHPFQRFVGIIPLVRVKSRIGIYIYTYKINSVYNVMKGVPIFFFRLMNRLHL